MEPPPGLGLTILDRIATDGGRTCVGGRFVGAATPPPIQPRPPLPLPPRPPPKVVTSSEASSPPAPAFEAGVAKLAVEVEAVTHCTLAGTLDMGLKVDVEVGLKMGAAMT
ncbi:MAG: hypothetical protein ACK55Z_01005, partial [bacterium]